MSLSKKSNAYCCVPQCKGFARRNPDLSFHRFPNLTGKSNNSNVDPHIRNEWIRLLKIGKTVTKSMVVCSSHFQASDYLPSGAVKKRYLKKTAIPSLNLPLSSVENKEKELKSKEDKVQRDNHYSLISHFPLHNPELSRKWTRATKRKDWEPSKFSVLCSNHFTENDYRSSGRYLKTLAVPSIYKFPRHLQSTRKHHTLSNKVPNNCQKSNKALSPSREQSIERKRKKMVVASPVAQQTSYVDSFRNETASVGHGESYSPIEHHKGFNFEEMKRLPDIKTEKLEETYAENLLQQKAYRKKDFITSLKDIQNHLEGKRNFPNENCSYLVSKEDISIIIHSNKQNVPFPAHSIVIQKNLEFKIFNEKIKIEKDITHLKKIRDTNVLDDIIDSVILANFYGLPVEFTDVH